MKINLLSEKVILAYAFVGFWSAHACALVWGTKKESVLFALLTGIVFGYVFYWYKSHKWYE